MFESLLISYNFTIFILGLIVFVVAYVIPFTQYKILAQFVGIIMVGLGLFFNGKEQERTAWEIKMNEARIEIIELQAKAQEINTVVLTEFYPQIRYVDKVQQQVVTEYVTKINDQACTINNGFVRLHDSVVTQVPISPVEEDKAPSTVVLSDVSIVVKDNYSACHRTAIQLKALQDWVKKQEKLWNESTK